MRILSGIVTLNTFLGLNMLSLQQRFPASRGLSRPETSPSREQQSLHDVFFINIAVSNSANSTQAACKYAGVIRISLAERNTCELLTEFRWLDKETWQGPLGFESVMRSKTRAVENFIMTSRLVNIRLGDTYYIHV